MGPQKPLLVIALCAILAGNLQGASVTFTLYPNQNAAGEDAAGQFRVTAKAEGDDNAGLASYAFTLTGGVTSVDHVSPWAPNALKGAQTGPAGFTWMRQTTLPYLFAYQDTPNPNSFIIYGLGKTAGSFAAEGVTVLGPDVKGAAWDAELLLAVGTFAEVAPRFGGLEYAATIFPVAGHFASRFADSVNLVTVPEPTGILLFALVAAMVGRRASKLDDSRKRSSSNVDASD